MRRRSPVWPVGSEEGVVCMSRAYGLTLPKPIGSNDLGEIGEALMERHGPDRMPPRERRSHTLSMQKTTRRTQIASLSLLLLFGCGERNPRMEPPKPVAVPVSVAEVPLRPEPGRKTIANLVGGFLWKPVSHSDTKLVVLLPVQLTGKTIRASSTLFTDAECRHMHRLGDGRYTGVHNGEREHYRFPAAGGDFKGPVWFGVRLKNGEQVLWEIRDPSRRLEL